MISSVETSGGTFRAGKPTVALRGSFRGGIAGINLAGNSFADYDLSPDRNQFVMFPSAGVTGEPEHPHVTLVTHWFDALRATFASSQK